MTLVTLIAAAVPDVMSSLEQVNTSPGTRHATIHLAGVLFLVPVRKDHHKQSGFSWQGQQNTFTLLLKLSNLVS